MTIVAMSGRALFTAAVSLFVACSPVVAAPGAARPPDGGASTAHASVASVASLVTVTGFDCEKPPAVPDPDAKHASFMLGEGIRAWRGGGPMGANWNVFDLRCVVRASTTCTKGKASLVLRVGQRVVAEREVALAGKPVAFDVDVAEKAWERGLDEAGKGPLRRQPYKTATFRAVVAIDCQGPAKASLRDSSYADVTAEDSFTAGFASGE